MQVIMENHGMVVMELVIHLAMVMVLDMEWVWDMDSDFRQ